MVSQTPKPRRIRHDQINVCGLQSWLIRMLIYWNLGGEFWMNLVIPMKSMVCVGPKMDFSTFRFLKMLEDWWEIRWWLLRSNKTFLSEAYHWGTERLLNCHDGSAFENNWALLPVQREALCMDSGLHLSWTSQTSYGREGCLYEKYVSFTLSAMNTFLFEDEMIDAMVTIWRLRFRMKTLRCQRSNTGLH